MALFKILKGLKANLPANKKDGYCYFTTDDQMFYIDYLDKNNQLQRNPLNANDAKTLTGASLKQELNNKTDEIPSSAVVFTQVDSLETLIVQNSEEIDTKMDKENPKGSGTFNFNTSYATGTDAVAFGGRAEGSNSFAFGNQSQATGNYSFAYGFNAKATGDFSYCEGRGNEASGEDSHAEGFRTLASAQGAHSEGRDTTASGHGSHAEGDDTIASGTDSHAEGNATKAKGSYSHAEGKSTTASGESSHAEGGSTTATGKYSHTSGNNTTATHKSQFVIGEFNALDNSTNAATSRGNYVFLIGNGTNSSAVGNALTVAWNGDFWTNGTISNASSTASGVASFASGGAIATGAYSHASGHGSTASGSYSHAEGSSTTASGIGSHSEGNRTYAIGENAHAEGYGSFYGQINVSGGANATTYIVNSTWSDTSIKIGAVLKYNDSYSIITAIDKNNLSITTNQSLSSTALQQAEIKIYRGVALGRASHSEGYNTTAFGRYSHSEGYSTTAFGEYSHTEGENTIALGFRDHAEGSGTIASGNNSHAEGQVTIASGNSSHAEGYCTIALAENSHSGGSNTEASRANSFAHGYFLTAQGTNQAVFGKYNAANTTDIFQIGGGTSDSDRFNAFSITSNGAAKIKSSLNIGGMSDDTGLTNLLFVSGRGYFESGVRAGTNYYPSDNKDLVTKDYVSNNVPQLSHVYRVATTEGTTSFDFSSDITSFTENYYLVYFNGLLLIKDVHYTINKAVINLLDWSCRANDICHVVGIKPINPAS